MRMHPLCAALLWLAALTCACTAPSAAQTARAAQSRVQAPAVRASGPDALRSPIPPSATQLLMVVSADWSSTQARLQRYARRPGGAFRAVGAPIPVVLGRNGYAWGDGLHGVGAPPGHSGPIKREGDGRSPAGVFELGTAWGYAPENPGLRIAYAYSTAAVRCVDDPASSHYNRVVDAARVTNDWHSAERMHRDDGHYLLAIEIEHNRAPIRPGHGSCIFLHVWAGPDIPVTGCTAMAKPDLMTVARWLEPGAAVMIALPRAQYSALRQPWGLP